MKINIKNVGLFAYLRISGARYLGYDLEEDVYCFESERSSDEWEVEYLNSDYYKFDLEVLNGKRQKRSKNNK